MDALRLKNDTDMYWNNFLCYLVWFLWRFDGGTKMWGGVNVQNKRIASCISEQEGSYGAYSSVLLVHSPLGVVFTPTTSKKRECTQKSVVYIDAVFLFGFHILYVYIYIIHLHDENHPYKKERRE